jgi:hypothetical protein
MSIQTENYNTEELVAGNIVSAVKSASATTYYRGQLLGRTDATGVYGPFNAAGSAGLEKIRAVCLTDTTLSTAGKLAVYITGSEVNGSGLKATNGTALTVTSAIIELAQDAGIVIK